MLSSLLLKGPDPMACEYHQMANVSLKVCFNLDTETELASTCVSIIHSFYEACRLANW